MNGEPKEHPPIEDPNKPSESDSDKARKPQRFPFLDADDRPAHPSWKLPPDDSEFIEKKDK